MGAGSLSVEKLTNELEQSTALRQALFKITELTDSAKSMAEFYAAIHHVVADLIYAENLFIILYDEMQEVHCPYFSDTVDNCWPSHISKESFDSCLTGYVCKTGQSILANQAELKAMEARGLFKVQGEWMLEWMGVPLKYGETILGAIVVQSYRDDIHYNESDKALLIFVSSHIALAVTRKRAEEALKKAHEDLEHRVEQRTKELTITNQHLEQQIRERQQVEQTLKQIQEELEIRVGQRTKQLSLSNTQLEQQIKERVEAEKRQATLYHIAELVNRPLELNEFYAEIHHIIRKWMYAENFYIALLNEDNQSLEFTYVVDQFNQEADYNARPYLNNSSSHQGFTEYVIKTCQPLLTGPENLSPEKIDWIGRDMYAWLGVPLMIDSRPMGALVVQSYSEVHWYVQRDKELLVFVSQHIATALKRRRDAELLRLAHAELKRMNDELEKRVAKRTSELSATNLALQKTLKEQDQTRRLQNALYYIADVTGAAGDVDELYKALHYIVAGMMYAENFYIAVCEDNSDKVSFPYLVDEYDKEYLKTMPKTQFLESLTGYVYKTGKPLLISMEELEHMKAQGIFKVYGKQSMVDWLGVPMKLGNEVLGAIVVQSYDEAIRYKESDKELLNFVSQHITTAIKRKAAEQSLKKAHEELEQRVALRTQELSVSNKHLEEQIKERERAEKLQGMLYEISDLTSQPIELDEFYEAIHHIIREWIYAENFFIALVDRAMGRIEFPYIVDQHDINYTPLPLGNDSGRKVKTSGFTEYIVSQGKPLLYPQDIEKEKTGDLTLIFQGRPAHAWLGVPLLADDKPIGVLAVQSYNKDIMFTEKDKELLTFVSRHIATALQRKYDADLLKLAHEELKVINDELEQRVNVRTRELSSANTRLQEMLEERKAIEQKLAHDACHDGLTDLPNRTLLLDRLDNAIKRQLRSSGVDYAVLFLDLDRFKVVNDSLGHWEGDQLLREVSVRLLSCVRPGDTVARMGGDEFCILVDGAQSESIAIRIAKRVLAKLSQPFILKNQTVFISASIGITLSSIGYQNPDTALRDADVAMYHAKAMGKAQYAIFNIAMHQHAINLLKLENELRVAVEQQKIELVYQPIVRLKDGTVVGFEALARWDHKDLGYISPAEFIPIAEETGLIFRLGLQILKQAALQVNEWRQLGRQFGDITVSVNLSAKQIGHPDLFENIISLFKSNNIAPDAVKFEITESLLIYNFDQSKTLLNQLCNENFKIMLDDFGTGYSSLSYLHHFPIHTLKIDRSFVSNLERHNENKEIIRTIKTLADSLNMSVIAEGIETETQARILSDFGFEYGQGYYFARPLKAENAKALLLQQDSDPGRGKVANLSE